MDSEWRTIQPADGRPYYHNTKTGETSWTKPESTQSTQGPKILSPRDRLIQERCQSWRKTSNDAGREYWYRVPDRKTQWEMPEEWKKAIEDLEKEESARPSQSDFVAGGGSSYPPQRQPRQERNDYRPPDRGGDRPPNQFQSHQNDGYRMSFAPAVTEPSYGNPEAAEKAFTAMLSGSNVTSDWAWEKAMKEVIKNPEYRAIADPRKRKRAFEKWSSENAALEKERAKEREAKAREDFMKMLKSHPEIKHYTRWRTIRPILEGEAMFKTTGNEAQRRQFYVDYLKILSEENHEAEKSNRINDLAELTQLLKQLDIGLLTTWDDAKGLLGAHDGDVESGRFKTLHQFDVLNTFETQMRNVEETHDYDKDMQKFLEKRKERHNREAWDALLMELKSNGKIHANSKWTEVYPLIQGDPRYEAMLRQDGSTPLELFWELIATLKESLLSKQNEVEDILSRHKFRFHQDTTIEDFNSAVDRDSRASQMVTDPTERSIIFTEIQAKIVKKESEDRYAREKENRRKIDALRSYIKHLDPRVRLGDTYESVRSRIEDSEEYHALRHSEDRRAAFDKHMRRLAEKEESNQERNRHDRDHRDRDRHRDRPGRSARFSRSTTPTGGRLTPLRTNGADVDAYEADRKKAQADRERVYSRGGRLSPPPLRSVRPRERDHRDNRYELNGGSERRVSASRSHLDRGPRSAPLIKPDPDRESARDRAVNRTLDYGDEGASTGGSAAGGRRRREARSGSLSDGLANGDKRDSKRLKKSGSEERKTREREAEEAAAKAKAEKEKEEEHLVSGSEEGEIEIEEAS